LVLDLTTYSVVGIRENNEFRTISRF